MRAGSQGLRIERLDVPATDPSRQLGFFHAISMPIRTYLITRPQVLEGA